MGYWPMATETASFRGQNTEACQRPEGTKRRARDKNIKIHPEAYFSAGHVEEKRESGRKPWSRRKGKLRHAGCGALAKDQRKDSAYKDEEGKHGNCCVPPSALSNKSRGACRKGEVALKENLRC